MTAVKRLWASVQGDPVFVRRVNGWLTSFRLAMIPVSYEVAQARELERQGKEPVEEKVVAKIVEETEVNRSA